MSRLSLTVYMRSYCHLCEAMLRELYPLQEQHGFELKIVDIDGDPVLEAGYGSLVPVLTHNDKEICHYFLDVSALQQYFRQA